MIIPASYFLVSCYDVRLLRPAAEIIPKKEVAGSPRKNGGTAGGALQLISANGM